MCEAICNMGTFTDDVYDKAMSPPVQECFTEQGITLMSIFNSTTKTSTYTKPVDTTSPKGQMEISLWDMSTELLRSYFDTL